MTKLPAAYSERPILAKLKEKLDFSPMIVSVSELATKIALALFALLAPCTILALPAASETTATSPTILDGSGSESKSDALSPAWLGDTWSAAAKRRKVSVWNSLPEEIADALTESDRVVTPQEVADLGQIAQTTEIRRLPEAYAAVRLLAILAEEHGVDVALVRPHLVGLLRSEHAGMRAATAEAIWQISDKEALSALEQALSLENDVHARVSLAHVVKILRR